MVKDELNNNDAPNGTPQQQDGGASAPTAVKNDEQQQADDQNLEPEQFRKMFIGGLTATTTDEMLRDYYSQWGELVDCVVMRDPNTKRSRGFGFVSYSKQAEVDLAMSNRPHVIDNKTVDPKRAVPREQSQRTEANVSSKRLYVSGVRDEHNEEMFLNHFSKYGAVLKAEIIMDKNTGKPRGFAFITFDDYDAVDKCVLHKSHMINNYRCDVKKALSKEEMSKAQQSERERMDRGGRSRGNVRGQWGGPMGGRGGPGGYDSRDSAWGVNNWGPSQGSSAGWGAPSGRGAPGYGGPQAQQAGYASAGAYSGGYQQQGSSAAWGAPAEGWGAPQPWGGQGWGQTPTGPSAWQSSSQGSTAWNQNQTGSGWGGRQGGY
uniref:Heterogeneous nuclear ribonucleoprotein A1 n=1 Tax=Steinernema glaseri TaxID=37863 RepID=A0A1I7Z1I5_9BILA